MEEVKAETKNKITVGEIVWICISGAIAVAGLTLVIFGIVGDYLPLKSSENWILLGEASFQNVMKMNYRWFGVILILFAAFVSVIFPPIITRRRGDIDEERRSKTATSSSPSANPLEPLRLLRRLPCNRSNAAYALLARQKN